MKYLLTILLLCVSVSAADRITLTITVTNAPADANTLTVGADVRTWKNTVATPSTQIAVGVSAGASATNLWNQIISYPYSGPMTPTFSSSNVITLRGAVGQAVTASASGTWATLTLSTQTVTELKTVRVPASGEPTQSTATNIQSQLASDLSTYSTNALTAGTTLVGNLVQTSGNQTVAGNKTFTGATTLNNASTYIDGGSVTNLNAKSITITHTNDAIVFGIARMGIDDDGWITLTEDNSGIHGNAMNYGSVKDGTVLNGIMGDLRYASLTGPNNLTGTNRLSATSLNATTLNTLANGNNAGITPSNAAFTRITAGPTAAFAVCGIVAPANNRLLILYNATGQNMTIAHESGVDATPANRILSMTGADQATTGDGCVILLYNTDVARWILVSIAQ